MTSIIHLLTDTVANQIAAGEVVQRPSSIVKELLENSIDAQSSKITLSIKNAGKSLIQVTDDGIGMNENDARLCFEPHATSKIRKTEDLFNIKTLGFRGEALSSISSVSQVVLKTKTKDAELGLEVKIEGAKFIAQTPIVWKHGCQFTIKNIFFNVPARRKFLKSNAVEMNHIYNEFIRIALAYPTVAFLMYVDDNEVYNLKSGDVKFRITSLFGKKYNKNVVKVENATESASIYGYIGTPDLAKKTRGYQYFFINGRYIKSLSLQSAVYQSFQYLLSEKQFPFFILFISLDTSEIDINVHPTKTEIKLQNEAMVFSFIRSTIRQTLTSYQISPSLDFKADVNWMSKLNPTSSKSDNINVYNNRNYDKSKDSTSQWQKLYEENITSPNQAAIDEFDNENKRLRNSNKNDTPIFANEDPANEDPNKIKRNSTIQIKDGIIVSSTNTGLLLVKQKEAHERVLFEKHLRLIKNNETSTSQRSIFPTTIELSNEDMKLMKNIWGIIENIGFIIEEFGPHTIKISGTPIHMADVSKLNFIEDMLAQYKLEESAFRQESTQKVLDDSKKKGIIVAKSLARKGAISETKILDVLEMENLIGQLFSCEFPNFSLDEKAIFCIIENEKLVDLINDN